MHLALQRFDPLIRSLAAGIDRPHAQFIPQLDQRRNGELLKEMTLKLQATVDKATQFLKLRGMAAAESRQGDPVFESLAIMTKFHKAMTNEVRLHDHVVALRCLERMGPVLHLALQNRILTTPQLEDLQSRLSQVSVSVQIDRVSKAEVLGYLELWDYPKAAGNDKLRHWCDDETPSWQLRLAPAGWWDQFKAELLKERSSRPDFLPLRV